MTPEGKLKAEVNDFLKRTGLLYFRMQSGIVKVKGGRMHLAPEGTADLLIFKGPVPHWVELKAPGQKTAKLRAEKQAEFRETVLSKGHKHARCESLEDVIALLR